MGHTFRFFRPFFLCSTSTAPLPPHRQDAPLKALIPTAALQAAAMDTRMSLVPVNPEMVARFRRLGIDPDEADGLFRRATAAAIDTLGPLTPIIEVVNEFLDNHLDDFEKFSDRLFFPTRYDLPTPPVSAASRLVALPADDVVDRVSRLPDTLLGDIVSRLPIKDAGRTAALSRSWRGVWCSVPLVLADADLLPVASAVSSVLTAHPGPFRCVHLTSSRMAEFPGLLTLVEKWASV
jgi:hypothetical protein